MNIYKKLGKELRLLFKDLFFLKHEQETKTRLEKILVIAKEIGEPVQSQAKQLAAEIQAFLKNPKDQVLIQRMKEHAEKLEAETREF